MGFLPVKHNGNSLDKFRKVKHKKEVDVKYGQGGAVREVTFREETTLKNSYRGCTYDDTLELLNDGYDLEAIAYERGLALSTIEGHIVELYKLGEISAYKIKGYSSESKLKAIKKFIEYNDFDTSKLAPIKDELPSYYSYFDIKIALAMMEEGDL